MNRAVLVDGLLETMRVEIERHYPQWGVTGLRPVGAGIENLVCRAESRVYSELAKKQIKRVLELHQELVRM